MTEIKIEKTKRRRERGNGQGGIVYLGKNRKRPYGVRITDCVVEGQQTFRYIGYAKTKTDAKKILAQNIVEPMDSRENLTFKQVYDAWEELYFKRNLSAKTKETYQVAFKLWKPLHGIKIKNIRTAAMQKVLNDLNDKQLSLSSIRKAKIVANLVFKFAESEDIVRKNYAYFLIPEGKRTEESDPFPVEDIFKLFENADKPNIDSILILFFTGFRISEFCNLKKSNINIDDGYIIGGRKTNAGTDRIVPIIFLINNLVRHRYDICSEYFIEGVKGHNLTSNHYRYKIYKPALETLGIEYRSPHKARHTCATIMYEAGVDKTAIAKILGHTNYHFSENKYIHPQIEHLKKEMGKVTEEVLKKLI